MYLKIVHYGNPIVMTFRNLPPTCVGGHWIQIVIHVVSMVILSWDTIIQPGLNSYISLFAAHADRRPSFLSAKLNFGYKPILDSVTKQHGSKLIEKRVVDQFVGKLTIRRNCFRWLFALCNRSSCVGVRGSPTVTTSVVRRWCDLVI